MLFAEAGMIFGVPAEQQCATNMIPTCFFPLSNP